MILRDGATATDADIIEFCRQQLSKFRVPEFVEFRDEVPRTSVARSRSHIPSPGRRRLDASRGEAAHCRTSEERYGADDSFIGPNRRWLLVVEGGLPCCVIPTRLESCALRHPPPRASRGPPIARAKAPPLQRDVHAREEYPDAQLGEARTCSRWRRWMM